MRLHSGFSLIELLMVLSIVSIVALLGMPGLQHFLNQRQDKMMLDQVLQAIYLAQTEAQARHISITLCMSKKQSLCIQHWSRELIIFIDENEEGQIDDKKKILHIIQSFFQSGELHWRSFPYYRHFLQFSSAELMRNDNGTFWYCRTNMTSPVWAIALSKTGKTHVIYPDQDGVIYDNKGHALNCD